MDRWLLPSRALFQGVGSAALMVCLLTGCGGSGGYDVSGTVTFDGAPIPAGKIYLTPDSTKGNSGAAGYADIKAGKYDTAVPGGKPTVGGPMLIGIDGIDPAAPGQKEKGDTSDEETVKSLFPYYETTVDLPKEKTTQSFDVPAEAANRKNAPESPGIIGP